MYRFILSMHADEGNGNSNINEKFEMKTTIRSWEYWLAVEK